MRIRYWIAGAFVFLAPLLFSQTSTNYQLTEYTFNNGGNPSPVLLSTSYSVTLDAIGDGLSAQGLASSSYGMDGGFGNAYPPPGEVLTLRFSDKDTLAWTPERSVGRYNLYRGTLGSFTGYGTCFQGGIANPTWDDATIPGAGSGYFYLVTAENRINEEGIKGRNSGGSIQPNPSPCP